MGSIVNFINFILITVCFGLVNSDKKGLYCKDESGNAVDWYVLYKIPKVYASSNAFIRKGTSYAYITNNTIAKGWKLSEKEINSKDSIPGITLATLYKDKVASSLFWVLYNDQAPNRKVYSARNGHAKGVVMVDANRGFWLIHSVPNYPPVPRTGTENKRRTMNIVEDGNIDINDNLRDGEYDYPETGLRYGQSYLCISMDASQMNALGLQLIYNQIISYRHNLPDVLSMKYPSLVNASTQMGKIKKPPYNRKVEMQSSQGLKFMSFAKSDKWQKDLYDDFVAPQLQSNLLTETWLNGPGKLPSECNGTQVLNIKSIILNAANVDFSSSRDHSKWAVSTKNKSNRSWVCVGDINRSNTQYSRGGGTVCINMAQLWSNYRNSVNDIEPCPKKPPLHKRVGAWLKRNIFGWI